MHNFTIVRVEVKLWHQMARLLSNKHDSNYFYYDNFVIIFVCFFLIFTIWPVASMMFQYYIKIVPTMYVKSTGDTIHTNQFSVTRHSKSVSITSGESGMPGIFFSYELSPLMVKYQEREK